VDELNPYAAWFVVALMVALVAVRAVRGRLPAQALRHHLGMEEPPVDQYVPCRSDLKLVSLDGKLVWKFCCPRCGGWGEVDDDQLHGRVSIRCPGRGCPFHETHDLSDLIDRTTYRKEE
jgi:hypothetical protein